MNNQFPEIFQIDFQGEIPASKSILNRALIVRSYFPVLDIIGDSQCDDVLHMKNALQVSIRDRNRFSCGEGGTTFRFLALRAARYSGVHTLEGAQRLIERPSAGLLALLSQLGVQCQFKGGQLFIVGSGWKKLVPVLKVETSESSQYASALLLNAWLLDFDLEFELIGTKVSESYFILTLEMVQKLGMRIQIKGNRYYIPAGQRINKLSWQAELDMSSAFSMAAAGALGGQVSITNFVSNSEQPDGLFPEILKKMNVELSVQDQVLKVKQSLNLKPIDQNLFQTPDLFPVLAVLCSWAEGTSRLWGAPQLAYKESNRIQSVARLFDLFDIKYEILPDGMIIHGQKDQKSKTGIFFDPDHDHRMAMAASLMKLKGHNIHIENPEVISKSFPEYWGYIGLQP